MTSTLNLGPHDHDHRENRFGVIPTGERLDIGMPLTGKGVTIAFLDTGFRPHPDLAGRVVAYHDVTDPDATLTADVPEEFAWHGTQTAVAGAGNGRLSDGRYRSLAPDASVVLVKARGRSGTHFDNTRNGLEWLLANHGRYGIRVVSISVGGGEDGWRADSPIDALADELVRQGVVVVAAAGNSGCTEQPLPLSPASARSVLTVGGFNDDNRPGNERPELYCSNFGVLPDGRVKPEVIAPAAWVAAPILPGTAFERRAEALSTLATVPDYRLPSLAAKLWRETELPGFLRTESPAEIRRAVNEALAAAKIVSTHYQHVDGTSFAAPITASIAACMLEANPALTPAQVRRILIQTADRISGRDALRQGFGRVDAARAIRSAVHETHVDRAGGDLAPRRVGDAIVFRYHDDTAGRVEIAGDLTGWGPVPMTRSDRGHWSVSLPVPAPGRRRYKFLVDGARWVEDPENDTREADGYGGMNSILNVG